MTKPSKTVLQKTTVLSIAGSDSAGMAGIQMDTRTLTAMGVHPATAITAVTAQNNQCVLSINPTSISALNDQLQAVETLPVSAIKIGLIANKEQLEVISTFVSKLSVPVVYDPVFSSTSGTGFSDASFIAALKSSLLEQCTLLTPNLVEAEQLTGIATNNHDDWLAAAQAILQMGVNAVLIKGGHSASDDAGVSQDYFCSAEQSFWLSSKKVATENTRGTGCALASSIASALALGYPLADAIVIGKMAINQGLRQNYGVDADKGPVAITHFPNQQVDLPRLTNNPNVSVEPESFPPCAETALGLYPIFERAEWLERVLPLGISTAQLRIKDLSGQALREEIAKGIEIARQYSCRLFINDYWQLAIELGAYGVHLGQEDLDTADIDAIRRAGLRLGLSSHCHYEVARAHSFAPSYIACGPVYHTTTKDMPWVPHDLSGLTYWLETLDYPVVAIGGINRERLPRVAATSVSGVAMITAITLADNPEQTAMEFQQMLANA